MTGIISSDSIQEVETQVAGSGVNVATLVSSLKPSEVYGLLSQTRDEDRPYGTATVLGAVANEHAKNSVVAILGNSRTDKSQGGKIFGYWLNQLGPVALALTEQIHGTMSSMLGRANTQKALAVATGGSIDAWGNEGAYQRGLAMNWKSVLQDVGADRVKKALQGSGYQRDTAVTDILGWTPDEQDGVFYLTELMLCGSRGFNPHAHSHGDHATRTWMHKVLPEAQHRFVDSGLQLRQRRLGGQQINQIVDGLYSDKIGSGVALAGFNSDDCAYHVVVSATKGGNRSPTGTFTLVDKTKQLAAAFRAVPQELTVAARQTYGPACNSVATLYDAVASNFEHALEGHPPVTQSISLR